MKISSAFFAIILEIAFIVYCIHMTYLLDVLDPLPREWMVPNMLIGAVILAFGLVVAGRLNRDQTTITDRK
jgi:multisubunit Na+/H+ antiporter MnhC subunit